jgi:fatty acid desaturase
MMIHEHPPETRRERPLSALFNQLLSEIGVLLHKEWELARAEMTQKASAAGKDVAMLALGGAIAYAGFLALIAALILGIAAAGLAWWLAALIVGVFVAAVGGGIVYYGLTALRRGGLVPEHTVRTLRDDARWLKEEAR